MRIREKKKKKKKRHKYFCGGNSRFQPLEDGHDDVLVQ